MVCGCEATISQDDSRAEIWLYVFGKRSFPLKHPLPHLNSCFPNMVFYSGDASALTPEQLEKLIEAMTRKFNITREQVLDSINDGVIPIRADNVTISICQRHTLGMLDFNEEE